MLALIGLKDDYSHSGRVLFEALQNWAVPDSLHDNRDTLTKLAQVFKQINAPVGELGLASLRVSTRALSSNSAGDSTYASLEAKLANITQQRNDIANDMSQLLEGAAFHGQKIDVQRANQLIEQGEELLEQVNTLAA